MLGKLLKYELKRSARKFFPLVLGYMIVALIFSLMLRYGESVKSPNFLMIFIVVSIAYGIAVGALFTVGFTISLTNFHKTLFTDEGYLMLTIPVKPYYHIFTKFISSVIWSAASMIVFVLSLLLIDPTEYLDSQEEVGKRRIEEASKYVLNNWMPAKTRLSYKGILPGCSAEGHVSHVLSARMSSLPKGWSQKGADAMAQLRAYYYNHGDMLELVKYQKEEEPKAVGNEGTFYSVTDIMSSERSRHGQMGKYFDSMQTRLTLDTRKKIYFNSNMKFL